MTDRPLRVAFIGAGQMARHHLSAIKRHRVPAVLVGVHDLAPGRAEESAALADTSAFASTRALLAETRPDVVHVCTPPRAHFAAAAAALDGGAHVYVEKPFALTTDDARTLLERARSRRLLVCAGHQLLGDRAFEALLASGAALGPLVQVDSHFAFRPVGMSTIRASARTLAEQLMDILPHPLYTLVAALERFSSAADAITLAWVNAGPRDLQAILRSGELLGRLSVSLRARPVASSLTLTGTRGSLTCDFIRSIVVGAANPGTEALEKVLNPMVEGAQLLSRTAFSVGRRILSGTSYPGLAELIAAFYSAVAAGGTSPVQPEHLLRVTDLFEALAAKVETAARKPGPSRASPPRTPWERQDERTPRPKDSRPLGPYTWGKCLQEELVEREAPALGIATRIVRPGALLDWNDPVLPGLMGRRLFGRWHLGLGRPGLPIAVCDVARCAEAIAWCATQFDEAPAIVNLF